MQAAGVPPAPVSAPTQGPGLEGWTRAGVLHPPGLAQEEPGSASASLGLSFPFESDRALSPAWPWPTPPGLCECSLLSYLLGCLEV